MHGFAHGLQRSEDTPAEGVPLLLAQRLFDDIGRVAVAALAGEAVLPFPGAFCATRLLAP